MSWPCIMFCIFLSAFGMHKHGFTCCGSTVVKIYKCISILILCIVGITCNGFWGLQLYCNNEIVREKAIGQWGNWRLVEDGVHILFQLVDIT